MRIALVTESLGSGGAERQLTGLAVLLAKNGHSCNVITWVNKNFYKKFLEQNNINHIFITASNKFDRILKLRQVILKYKCDAIISYLPMANETCALAMLGTGIKLIVSERSFTSEWGFRRKFTDLLYRRAEFIVANSNNEAENIRKHNKKLASKVRAIPNFIDVDIFKARSDAMFSNNSLKFIGVGRIIPSKNLIRLIESLAIAKTKGLKFKFDWFGDTYDKDYLAKVKAYILKFGLSEEFKLCGVSDNIAVEYRKHDIMCVPSLLEGYPNVLIEAMASGLPVIASNICEHPSIIDEGINGFLFDPTDNNSITAAILKISNLDISELNLISNKNRQKVVENNSKSVFVNNYLSLLQ